MHSVSPERFKILQDTASKVFADPDFRKAVEKTKAPWELIQYGDQKTCAEYAKSIMAIGEQYKDLLSGKA